MSSNELAVIFAAGVALVVYVTLGKRLGYGNTKLVWTVVGATFVVAYIIMIITFSSIVHVK